MVDLEAYFDRIGYSGPADPTLETLAGIVSHHVEVVPFENIDVLLGRPIELTPDAIQRKIVTAGRGGYCFEQNGLLLLVLDAIGFNVLPLSARVRLQRPRDVIPARTHMFLRVEIGGVPWLADVGIGGVSLSSPIRLDIESEQATAHEPRRIVRENGRFFHQVRFGDEWADVYEFTGEAMPLVDREVANWFTSTSPQSHFRLRLIAARALPDGGRVTLVNRELSVRGRDGRAQTRLIGTPDELMSVLDASFGLRFEPGTSISCEGLDFPVLAPNGAQ
jgi:N-hydroxyarylamine O-acetyltransferase